MKRLVFLTSMVLFHLVIISVIILISNNFFDYLGFILLTYIILTIIFLFVYSNTESRLFITGFNTIKRKRIYYSDIGYFYLDINPTELTVYKQSWFYTKKLFSIFYTEDIEYTKKQIKRELDILYKEKNQKKNKIDIIKNWDGNLDLKSQRDHKISTIIK